MRFLFKRQSRKMVTDTAGVLTRAHTRINYREVGCGSLGTHVHNTQVMLISLY
jgi:hypothetical protein